MKIEANVNLIWVKKMFYTQYLNYQANTVTEIKEVIKVKIKILFLNKK